MAFDVSDLAAFIEQRDFPLVGYLQVAPELTASQATIQLGLKGTSDLHYMETDVVFQNGAGCARSASGTTAFTNKPITVAQVAIAEDLCLDDLRNKWTQIMLKQGTMTGKQVMPEEIAAIYFEEKTKKLIQAIELADFQGNTLSPTANLNRYDGWLKIIDAAGDAVNGNTGGVTALTGVTVGNILAILEGIWLSRTEELSERTDNVMYIPKVWYDLYISALKAANLFHYKSEDGETLYYGTDVRLRPTYGLRTLNRAILTYPENFIIGMDGDNDTEFSFRVDPVTNKKILVDSDWTRGTQVWFTNQVVEFTLEA
jgi:hypothetical protein